MEEPGRLQSMGSRRVGHGPKVGVGQAIQDGCSLALCSSLALPVPSLKNLAVPLLLWPVGSWPCHFCCGPRDLGRATFVVARGILAVPLLLWPEGSSIFTAA